MKTTCIMCPVGCGLLIEEINGEVVVKGNACLRGQTYGKSEFLHPTRIVTCSLVGKDKIFYTKTDKPIPKEKMFDVIDAIKNLPIKDYKIGDVACENILNTDANIVITGQNHVE